MSHDRGHSHHTPLPPPSSTPGCASCAKSHDSSAPSPAIPDPLPFFTRDAAPSSRVHQGRVFSAVRTSPGTRTDDAVVVVPYRPRRRDARQQQQQQQHPTGTRDPPRHRKKRGSAATPPHSTHDASSEHTASVHEPRPQEKRQHQQQHQHTGSHTVRGDTSEPQRTTADLAAKRVHPELVEVRRSETATSGTRDDGAAASWRTHERKYERESGDRVSDGASRDRKRDDRVSDGASRDRKRDDRHRDSERARGWTDEQANGSRDRDRHSLPERHKRSCECGRPDCRGECRRVCECGRVGCRGECGGGDGGGGDGDGDGRDDERRRECGCGRPNCRGECRRACECGRSECRGECDGRRRDDACGCGVEKCRGECGRRVCECGKIECRGKCRRGRRRRDECRAEPCGCGCGDKKCGPRCPRACRGGGCTDCTTCGQVRKKCRCIEPRLCAGTLVPLERCDFRCVLPVCRPAKCCDLADDCVRRPRPCASDCRRGCRDRERCDGRRDERCGGDTCGRGDCDRRGERGRERKECGGACGRDRNECKGECGRGGDDGGNGGVGGSVGEQRYDDALHAEKLAAFKAGEPITVSADDILAWRIDPVTLLSRNAAVPAAFGVEMLGRTAGGCFVFRARPANIFRNPMALRLLRLLALSLWRLEGLLPLHIASSRWARIYQFCVNAHTQWWVRLRRARTGVLFPELPQRQLRFYTYQETLAMLALQRRALACRWVARPIGLCYFRAEACRRGGNPLRCWGPVTEKVRSSTATYVVVQRAQSDARAPLSVLEPEFIGPVAAFPTAEERALLLETIFRQARDLARCLYARGIQIDFHAPDALVVDCNNRVWATALRRLQLGYVLLTIEPYLAVVDSYTEFGPGLGVNGIYDGDNADAGAFGSAEYDAQGFDLTADFPLDSTDIAALALAETSAGSLVEGTDGGTGRGVVADVPGGLPPNGGDTGVLPSAAAAINVTPGSGLLATPAAANPLLFRRPSPLAPAPVRTSTVGAFRSQTDGGAAAYRALALGQVRGKGRP